LGDFTLPITQRGWYGPVLLSAALCWGLAHPIASPVRDAVTEHSVLGYQLLFSPTYLVLAPWCSLADAVTILSLKELYILFAYVLVIGFLFFRGLKQKLLYTLGFLAFMIWGALANRPAARLVTSNSDILLIDFHSHTMHSHDGRPGFSATDNMEWHRRQGFNAAFISDHNTPNASHQAKERSRRDWKITGYRSLEGNETSLYQTHLNVLGSHRWIDNRPYDTGMLAIPKFVKEMKHEGYVVTANLPEYWRFHWSQGRMAFLSWPVDGFEIANSAPRALDFPQNLKQQIIHFCEQHDLFVDGASDTHGWGYATSVWNAMVVPGWQTLDPDQLEKNVLEKLKTEGRFHAVQVLERVKFFPHSFWELAISPFGNGIILLRTLGFKRALSFFIWTWFLYVLSSIRIGQHSRR